MRHIVLIGGSHVHRQLLGARRNAKRPANRMTLIAPSSFWYGGAVTALMAGAIDADRLRQGYRGLCDAAGVTLRGERAVGLDCRHRRVWLSSGKALEYDAVSLGVGRDRGLGMLDAIAGIGPRLWSAHSVAELARFRSELVTESRQGNRRRVVIAGSGRRAVDVVMGLSAADSADRVALTLLMPGTRLLEHEAPAAVSRRLVRVLALRGVDVVFSTMLAGIDEAAALSTDGRRFAADHVLAAGAASATALVHTTGLACDPAGLCVGRRLYAPADPRVFATGGCASLPGRSGLVVENVSTQGRVLARNVTVGEGARPYRRYRPAPRRGRLDLGDGTGIVWHGRLSWRSRAAACAIAREIEAQCPPAGPSAGSRAHSHSRTRKRRVD